MNSFRAFAANLQFCRRSAVYIHHLRRNETRFVGSEKQHGVCHVLRVARTFDQLPDFKVAREDMLAGGGRETPRENLPGANAVDADVMASAQASDVASKTLEAGLGGNVRSGRKSGVAFKNGFTHSRHGRQGRHIYN